MKLNLSESMKKKLLGIAVAVFLIVWGVSFFFGGVEPIEDINGPDDTSLAVLTEEDITAKTISSSGLRQSSLSMGDLLGNLLGNNGTVRFHSKNFNGIYEIQSSTILYSTGNVYDIIDFKINSGNCRLFVVNEGKIVAELSPEDDFPVDVGALEGFTRLLLAGESADFSFRMWKSDVNHE